MPLFGLPFRKKKRLLTLQEEELVVNAIRDAEHHTSGEVRVYMESKCHFVDPLDRAREVFEHLKMFKTNERNAVLVYIALKDKQAAIFGDESIHQRVNENFWNDAISRMLGYFKNEELVAGICHTITTLGDTLSKEFPYDKETDKNELPDTIVFGR